MPGGQTRAARASGPIELREQEEQYVEISEDDADWLRRVRPQQIAVEPRHDGTWLVRVGRICGVLRLPGGRRIQIEPRVHVDNLWALLHLAGETGCLSEPPVSSDTVVGLIDGLMGVYAREVAALIEHGIAADYHQVERTTRSLRGRLDVARQIRDLPGRPDRFACRFAEFSRDSAQNRVLAAALEVVWRVAQDAQVRNLAARCLRDLGGETDVRVGPEDLRAARVDAATRHYRVPLSLARLIIEPKSVSHHPGSELTRTPSLLVDMPRLFEQFVCRTLQLGLPETVGVRSEGHRVALDEHRQAMLSPDAVLEGQSGPLCVVDAKYKPQFEGRTKPSTEDLYQMLAYCVGYAVNDAVLIYPRAVQEPPLRINHPGFRGNIHLMGIDLSGDVRTLRSRGEQLCARIAKLCGLAVRETTPVPRMAIPAQSG